MQSADLEVLQQAIAWLETGEPVALATVAATFGSSPRPVGAQAVLRADGRLAGSVSGGCIEDDLAARVRGHIGGPPRVLRYGVDAADALRFGLPCGGRMELVLEHIESAEPLRPIVRAIAARRLIGRRLCIATGEASLHASPSGEDFRYDGRDVVKIYGPRWRLLIIGAGQLSRFLAELALGLDYEVVVCDPRAEYAAGWRVEGATLDARMPDDAVRALINDARCAVVAATHDPKLDDLALLDALETEAFYVGALGSDRTNARRRERLATLGVSAGALARLHGPVGLPLGSRTPAEIAVAVGAHLIAARAGRELVLWDPSRARNETHDARACGR